MPLKLLKEGAPELYKASEETPNSFFGNDDFKEFIAEMHDVRRNNGGIGLAAPQIGCNYRIFVMGDYNQEFTCINPKIIAADSEIEVGIEGCLSFPGLEFKVSRPSKITAVYYDVEGDLQSFHLDGVWARCFQHELDHLDGMVFTERGSKTHVNIARKKVKKNLKTPKNLDTVWK